VHNVGGRGYNPADRRRMHEPDSRTTDSPPASRLSQALHLGLAFRSSGRTDADAFLAEHPDLRDLIEPMIRPSEHAGAATDPTVTAAPSTPASAITAPPGFAHGAEIAGYVIERRLGQGGMGTVFLATQRSLGRQVALKVLSAPIALLGERSRWRFQRESRLLAELSHPGIVRVLEAGTIGDLPFYAMEFIDGAPVSAVLDAVRRAGLHGANEATVRGALLSAIGSDGGHRSAGGEEREYVALMVDIAAQVGEALACAHAAGVVHRDVKPSNVLVRRDGRALLADFGVARRDGGARMTLTGDLAGTPTYMSPEQARGEAIDHRSDVFSLGVLLYECLTLQLPFAGESSAAALASLQRQDQVDPRRHNPRVSADLAAVVDKALQKEPLHRYQTANDFADDLRALLAGRAVTARHPTAVQRLRRWARREPWQAAAAAIALVAITAGLVGSLVFTQRLLAESQRTATALAEVHRLAIGVRLDRAESEAEAFRIARIDLAPQMQLWLREQGEPLAKELPRLQAMWAALAERALPYGPAAAAADRERHPEYAMLRRIDDELAGLDVPVVGVDTTAADTKRRQQLLAVAEPMRARVAERRTWAFPDEETQFLHDQVAQLVQRLQQVATTPGGWLARVQRQLAWAEAGHRRCQVEGAEAWRTAIAAIAASPRYGGLAIHPQFDLLPVGADPSSGLWEFVHLRSGTPGKEVPPRRANGSIEPTDDMGVVFVLVPGGSFTMGAQAQDATAPNHDPGAGPYETPVHTIVLSPFFLAKFEATQTQWQQLSEGDAPSLYSHERKGTAHSITPRHPVESVTAHAASNVLSQHGLLLPTEAQWEYACRAGTATPWHFGAREHAAQFANFADASAVRAGARWECERDLDDGHALHAPVGTYLPNAFGLHDMHGNVSEITADFITQYSRTTEPGTGRRHAPYDAKAVIFRGGSHSYHLTEMRSADRTMSESVEFRASWLGVRIARAIER